MILVNFMKNRQMHLLDLKIQLHLPVNIEANINKEFVSKMLHDVDTQCLQNFTSFPIESNIYFCFLHFVGVYYSLKT